MALVGGCRSSISQEKRWITPRRIRWEAPAARGKARGKRGKGAAVAAAAPSARSGIRSMLLSSAFGRKRRYSKGGFNLLEMSTPPALRGPASSVLWRETLWSHRGPTSSVATVKFLLVCPGKEMRAGRPCIILFVANDFTLTVLLSIGRRLEPAASQSVI